MPKMTSVRMSDPEAERLQDAAEKMGVSLAEVLRAGGLMFSEFDPWFLDIIQKRASGLRISPALFIQNIVIKWLADKAAFLEVFEKDPRALSEFMFTADGPITGQELYENIKANEMRTLKRDLREG